MVKQVDFIMAYFKHLDYHFVDEECGWNSSFNKLKYTDKIGQTVYVSFNRDTEDVSLIRITKLSYTEYSTIFSGSFDEFLKAGGHKEEIRDFKIQYLTGS